MGQQWAIPIQGMYSASKHAVKGFTDALRMELEHEGVPISVTLVKPGSIDTPFPQHARNYMANEPELPPPVYSPNAVAEAILQCAESPQRDVTVGMGGKLIASLGQWMPGVMDKILEATVIRGQHKAKPAKNPRGALHQPNGPQLSERGETSHHVFGSSAYTIVSQYPAVASIAAGLGILAIVLLVTALRSPAQRGTFARRLPFLKANYRTRFTRL